MKSIRHTGIVVDDLERADFFYRRVLGLQLSNSKTEVGEYIQSLLGLKCLTWVKLKTEDGSTLELYWLPCKNQASFNHVAFTVNSVEDLKDKFLRFGIRHSDIQLDADKKHKVMFCRDYDNNLIELVEEVNEQVEKKKTDSGMDNSKEREVRQTNHKPKNAKKG